MDFSRRTDWPLVTNALTDLYQDKIKLGISPINLTESNPTKCGFGVVSGNFLQVPEYDPNPHGSLAARQTIVEYYSKKGIKVNPSQIFLTASTSEAYSFLFKLFCDPTDSILVPRPSYPLLEYLGALSDVKLSTYRIDHIHDRWQIDLQGLELSFSSSVKALTVVNPNNPTGNFISPKERDFLNSFCHKKKIPIISDEVFIDFNIDQNVSGQSFADNKEILTLTLSGISKVLALPQMKLSWIVVSGPQTLVKAASDRLEIIGDSFLSANAIAQAALPLWFENQSAIQKEIIQRLRSNFNCLKKELSSSALFEVLSPQGGWMAILKIKNSNFTEEKMALDLLEKKNILVHPGYFFDFEEGEHLLISLLPQEEIFRRGLRELMEYDSSAGGLTHNE